MDKKTKHFPQKNELVVQHNYLIEARYRLSLQEKRLIFWLASEINRDDDDFKEHHISIMDFQRIVGVSNKNMHKEIAKITMRLVQRGLAIRDLENDTLLQVTWLNSAFYEYKKGYVTLAFSPRLKPYLLQLKDSFTKINFSDILGLKSVHAIRIYELLKQYESIGAREMQLSSLRELCGINTQQYKKFNDLKRDVLERSKREINTKTDIFVDYKEIKTSRKITSIEFTIKKNPKYKQTEFERSQQEKTVILQKEYRSDLALIERLVEYGFTKQKSKIILQQGTQENIANALKAVDIQVSRGNVKNPKAMLLTAIQEKWHPEKYKDKHFRGCFRNAA